MPAGDALEEMWTMTFSELERFLRYVALPPFKLGVRSRLIEECQQDPGLSLAAGVEADVLVHVQSAAARDGWWN